MNTSSHAPRTSGRGVAPASITSPRRSVVRTLAVAVAALGLVMPACKSDKAQPPAVVALQPVPAPAGHVADVFIPTPDATWQLMRAKLGGPMALLPATFPGAVVTILGLSPQLLEQIDSNVPAYGVWTDDGKRMVLVMGVHVRDGARAVTLLTDGADAKFKARPDPSGVTLLDPTPTNTAHAAALGVTGNYLLWAETSDDLVKSGPYVARTLPTRPAEKGQIVMVATRASLAGPLAKRVRDGWAAFRKEKEDEDKKLRQEHGGKAPDFGDPAAALADVDGKVSRVATLLSDLEEARATIDFDNAGVHARLTMKPAADNGPATQEFAAMVTGDTAPLLALPRGSLFGLLTRDSSDVRKQSSADQADSITKILGDRIGADDAKKLHDALSMWAQSRGDWLSAGLEATADGKTLVINGALADGKQLDDGLRAILALASVPAFKEPIETHIGKLTLAKPVAADGTVTVHVKREQAGKDAKPEKTEFDVAWQAAEKAPTFTLLVNQDAKTWFKQRGTAQDQTIASDPDLSSALRGLGNDVAFAAFLEPIRLMASLTARLPKGAEPPAAPMLFSYGGNKTAAWFRLDLSDDATREVVKVLSRR